MSMDSSFATSTHNRFWTYEEAQVRRMRQETHQRALKRFGLGPDERKRLEDEFRAQQARHPGGPHLFERVVPCDAEPLTMAEEALVRRFYENYIQQTCQRLQLPLAVTATAITFFKRHYLLESVMEHDPKYIMLASLYLACKAEESYIPLPRLLAETVAKKIKLAGDNPEQVMRQQKLIEEEGKKVVDLEIPLLERLQFHLHIYHPFKSLNALLLRAKDSVPADRFRELVTTCEKWISGSMFTDVHLSFTPGQVAWATVISAARAMKLPQVEGVLKAAIERDAPNVSKADLEQLGALVPAIHKFLHEGVKSVIDAPTQKLCLAALQKLKTCRNPMRDPESRPYQDAVAEQQRLSQLKQAAARQRDAERQRASEADLLGSPTKDDDAEDSVPNGGGLFGRKPPVNGIAAQAGGDGSDEDDEEFVIRRPAKRRRRKLDLGDDDDDE